MVLKNGVSLRTVDLISVLVLIMVVAFSFLGANAIPDFSCSFPAGNRNVYSFVSYSL